nr:hypothetical protein BgiMline_013867 [Biomphalaria glabrata]
MILYNQTETKPVAIEKTIAKHSVNIETKHVDSVLQDKHVKRKKERSRSVSNTAKNSYPDLKCSSNVMSGDTGEDDKCEGTVVADENRNDETSDSSCTVDGNVTSSDVSWGDNSHVTPSSTSLSESSSVHTSISPLPVPYFPLSCVDLKDDHHQVPCTNPQQIFKKPQLELNKYHTSNLAQSSHLLKTIGCVSTSPVSSMSEFQPQRGNVCSNTTMTLTTHTATIINPDSIFHKHFSCRTVFHPVYSEHAYCKEFSVSQG